jgi:2'-5' RNA ligase
MPLHFPLHAAFLALPLEGDAREMFEDVINRLHPFRDFLRFQNPDTPHLTLHYWKEMMEIEYGQVRTQMESIAMSNDPFTLQVIGPHTFATRGRTQVLFLDVAFSPELAALKKRCPWPNVRPFAPHITLARVTHPEQYTRMSKAITKVLAKVSFPIVFDRLRLYAEVDGVPQTPLAEVGLRGITLPPSPEGVEPR